MEYLRLRAAGRQEPVMTGRTLIVAPHPDDEVIGCGGLIARLVAEGHRPEIIVMTGGGGSHRGCCATPEDEIITARRVLTRDALSILGVPAENIHELDFVDGSISEESCQTTRLAELIAELRPDNVVVPHWGEGWSDHVATARIVKSLVKDRPVNVWEYCVWMWFYNVWRGLDWDSARCLTLSGSEHELKLRAMDAYTTQLAPCGRPWSGVLPEVFLNANRGKKEIYFEVK